MSDDRFRELDKVFSDILAGISASGRTRSARLIGQEIRRSQQQRIRAQKGPDGAAYPQRRRRIIRSQQGIKFIWNNEVRTLKNWHGGRGNTDALSLALTPNVMTFARFTAAILIVIWKLTRARCVVTRHVKRRCLSACAHCGL